MTDRREEIHALRKDFQQYKEGFSVRWTGVIAIDGPAGAGKSTVAKLTAKKLGVSYLDTGALYRSLAYYLDGIFVPPEENDPLRLALRDVNVELRDTEILLNGTDVSSKIRTPAVDKIASLYSALPSVREKLLNLQREQALLGGLVADGRDMGTVVFPYAPLKIFLTAAAEVRARRRYEELLSRGATIDYEKILEEIRARDYADANRAISPLKPATDALLIDSSDMTAEQVADEIVRLAEKVSHG